MQKEVYISVDVETAGPYPGQYAMLSIGACLVDDTSTTFYVELQPDRSDSLPEALAISGLSLDSLEQHGIAPQKAMQDFADWLTRVVPSGSRAVFVALNAPFDWMFVNDYFYRYLGSNPFGHSGLDMKAFYMGFAGASWSETSMKDISSFLFLEKSLVHNALHDAQDQADIFRALQERSQKRGKEIYP